MVSSPLPSAKIFSPFRARGHFPSLGKRGAWPEEKGSLVPPRPTCHCLLCQIESQLATELGSSLATYDLLRSSNASVLGSFDSPSGLLAYLRAARAGPGSDALLRDLLAARSVEPQFIETLLIVAFVPVLHATIRRIAKQQVRLARADIVQQALSVFLELLRSETMRNRQSHLAFALARALKRELFEWAAREGAVVDAAGKYAGPCCEASDDDEVIERNASLRHFLCRCFAHGLLNDSELNLLFQVKLDGNSGEEVAVSNAISSNAVRQRMKRLLAKLRRIASASSG
jgi:DNA-directed RNA polymerase specialized sigma24 family protein